MGDMLLLRLMLLFIYILLISRVYTAVIEIPDKFPNATKKEIGNFSSDTTVSKDGNRSVETNSSVTVHSSNRSFDNQSAIQESVPLKKQYTHPSSQISSEAQYDITILDTTSLKTSNKTFHNNGSKENIYPSSTKSSIQYLATFQADNHLKKKHQSKRFVKNSFSFPSLNAPSLFIQRIAAQFQYLRKASSFENKINQTLRNDALCQRQIRSIFRLAKFGTPSLLRCNQPAATITVKCISNIARVTLTSESEDVFDAKISFNQRDGKKFMLKGYNHNSYLVWWDKSNRIITEFNHKLTREMIERKCESCSKMEAMLKLENENQVCLIPVNCEEPNNQIIKLITFKTPIVNYIRNTPVFVLSMSLQDFEKADNQEITQQKFPSDTTVDIVIQATSDAMPVGVYVRECRIRSGLKSVVILVNGCSISNLLDNFTIMRKPNNKKFVLGAKFIPFSINDPSKNHTLECTIMICEGICDVQSSCQNHLKDHPNTVEYPRVLTDVNLQTSYKILPELKTKELSKIQNGNQSQKSIKEMTVKEHIQCTEICPSTMQICYIYLVFLSIFFLFLISIIFFCLRQKMRRIRNKIEEEVESPQRIFYHEECSTRRRSPNNSIIFN